MNKTKNVPFHSIVLSIILFLSPVVEVKPVDKEPLRGKISGKRKEVCTIKYACRGAD